MTVFMRFFTALILMCLMAIPSVAEDMENSLFIKLLGQWHSEGVAFGQDAISRMTWALALDGRFYRLDYAIEMNPGTDKASTFTGTALYKQQDVNTYKAFWADNSGDLHPITATIDGNVLTSIWGVKGEKLGRTSYDMLSSDQVQITDWIFRDEEWQQFNQAVFNRVEP